MEVTDEPIKIDLTNELAPVPGRKKRRKRRGGTIMESEPPKMPDERGELHILSVTECIIENIRRGLDCADGRKNAYRRLLEAAKAQLIETRHHLEPSSQRSNRDGNPARVSRHLLAAIDELLEACQHLLETDMGLGSREKNLWAAAASLQAADANLEEAGRLL